MDAIFRDLGMDEPIPEAVSPREAYLVASDEEAADIAPLAPSRYARERNSNRFQNNRHRRP